MSTGSPESGEALRRASGDDAGDETPDAARAGSIGMTTIVVIVVVAAVAGAIGFLAKSMFGMDALEETWAGLR